MGMIARIWRGVVGTEHAEVYRRYIEETGFSAYKETPGNQGAWLLRRDDDGRTEFLAFTLWDSVEAIKAFAGEDIEAAVYYPKDERYLIQGEDWVRHYDVESASG
jgi:heme-degrading monooxygenase HmoA